MSRLVTLPVHVAIEIAFGTALMAAPFAFGFGPAATVTAVAAGALLVGLALAATGDSGSDGRGTISVSAHSAYDQGLAAGLVAAAVALGIAGDAAALGVLAAAGVALATLHAVTRYSVAGA